MSKEKIHGEGNPEADRRYRKGVEDTVENTTHEERAEKARDVDPDQARSDAAAAERAKDKARKA